MRKVLIATLTAGLLLSSVALAGPNRIKGASAGTAYTQTK